MVRCQCGATCSEGAVRCYVCGRTLRHAEPTEQTTQAAEAQEAETPSPSQIPAQPWSDQPPIAYCRRCEARLPPNARFCPECGMVQNPTSAKSEPQPGQPFPWLQLPWPARKGAAKRKSPLLAAVLEFLITGVGLMYAGAVRVGIAVLLGSILVFGAAIELTGGVVTPMVQIGVVAWAVVRIYLAINVARAHNARLDHERPSP
jgi:zinc-ribbon domain